LLRQELIEEQLRKFQKRNRQMPNQFDCDFVVLPNNALPM